MTASDVVTGDSRQSALEAEKEAARKIKEEDERKREDLALVLGSLIGWNVSDPSKWLTADLKRFGHDDPDPMPIVVGDSLKDLQIANGAPVFVGGGGVIFQVQRSNVQGLHYALKVGRPSVVHNDEEFAENVAEFIKHSALSHEYVARLYTPAVVRVPVQNRAVSEPLRFVKTKRPHVESQAMLIEWVEDGKPLAGYIIEKTSSHAEVVSLLAKCFMGLGYLHRSNLIHWDMKSDNFLVDARGTPKLMDVGNARIAVSEKPNPIVFSTRGRIPPGLASAVCENKEGPNDSKRLRLDLSKADGGFGWNRPWLDLWMLGQELRSIFDWSKDLAAWKSWDGLPHAKFLERVFPEDDDEAQFTLSYICLILRRLTKPSRFDSPRYYETADEVATDLLNRLPEFGGAQGVPELSAVPKHVLRAPISGNIPFSNRVRRLFDTKMLDRLKNHKQLGSIRAVYPGAMHTRSEHVAGVFFTVCDYVRALYADRENPFWRASVSRRDVEALLVAALVHDVGHIAFGHYLEELIPLFLRRTHEDYAQRLLGKSDGSSREVASCDVETLCGLIAKDWGECETNVVEAEVKPPERGSEEWQALIRKEANQFCQYVAEILRPSDCGSTEDEDQEGLTLQTTKRLVTEVLHSIIDSAIDADKLDYLNRDALHCGVPYADGIDIDRFYQSLTVMHYWIGDGGTPSLFGASEQRLTACIGVSEKGVLSVESILMARYHMFRSVYWHRTARIHTALLQYAVRVYLSVGGSRSADEDKTILARLDKLIEAFHGKNDDAALKWLSDTLANEFAITEMRGALESAKVASKTLTGQAPRQYKEIFALQFAGKTDEVDAVLSAIEGLAKRHARSSPSKYLNSMFILERRLANALIKRACGKDKEIAIPAGALLIDVPPANRDQVSNIFVSWEGERRALHDITPVSRAMRDAFASWVRTVRIFVDRETFKTLRKNEAKETEGKTFDQRLRRYVLDAMRAEMRAPESPLFDDGQKPLF